MMHELLIEDERRRMKLKVKVAGDFCEWFHAGQERFPALQSAHQEMQRRKQLFSNKMNCVFVSNNSRKHLNVVRFFAASCSCQQRKQFWTVAISTFHGRRCCIHCPTFIACRMLRTTTLALTPGATQLPLLSPHAWNQIATRRQEESTCDAIGWGWLLKNIFPEPTKLRKEIDGRKQNGAESEWPRTESSAHAIDKSEFSWITAEICRCANLQSNFYCQVHSTNTYAWSIVTVT